MVQGRKVSATAFKLVIEVAQDGEIPMREFQLIRILMYNIMTTFLVADELSSVASRQTDAPNCIDQRRNGRANLLLKIVVNVSCVSGGDSQGRARLGEDYATGIAVLGHADLRRVPGIEPSQPAESALAVSTIEELDHVNPVGFGLARAQPPAGSFGYRFRLHLAHP